MYLNGHTSQIRIFPFQFIVEAVSLMRKESQSNLGFSHFGLRVLAKFQGLYKRIQKATWSSVSPVWIVSTVMSTVALGPQLLDHTGPGMSLGPIFWSPFSSIATPRLRHKATSTGFSASLGCMEVFGG